MQERLVGKQLLYLVGLFSDDGNGNAWGRQGEVFKFTLILYQACGELHFQGLLCRQCTYYISMFINHCKQKVGIAKVANYSPKLLVRLCIKLIQCGAGSIRGLSACSIKTNNNHRHSLTDNNTMAIDGTKRPLNVWLEAAKVMFVTALAPHCSPFVSSRRVQKSSNCSNTSHKLPESSRSVCMH